jgi:hypothetical protein
MFYASEPPLLSSNSACGGSQQRKTSFLDGFVSEWRGLPF